MYSSAGNTAPGRSVYKYKRVIHLIVYCQVQQFKLHACDVTVSDHTRNLDYQSYHHHHVDTLVTYSDSVYTFVALPGPLIVTLWKLTISHTSRGCIPHMQ